MEVPYDEGVASHIGPESCTGARKGAGEALTGESAGRALSRESEFNFRVPTVSPNAEGNTGHPVSARDGLALRGRRPRARMETFCTGTGRSHARPWEMALGDAP
jgi:RNA-directed DNA polymerase